MSVPYRFLDLGSTRSLSPLSTSDMLEQCLQLYTPLSPVPDSPCGPEPSSSSALSLYASNTHFHSLSSADDSLLLLMSPQKTTRFR